SRAVITCQRAKSSRGGSGPSGEAGGADGSTASGVGDGAGFSGAGGVSNSGGSSWANNGPPTAATVRASARTLRLIVNLLWAIRAGRAGSTRAGRTFWRRRASPSSPGRARASAALLGGRQTPVEVVDDVLDVLAPDGDTHQGVGEAQA